MICQSSALSDVDRQLHDAYAKAIVNLSPVQKKQFIKDQRAWLKHRAQCTNQDCIHSSLMNRLTEIDRYVRY